MSRALPVLLWRLAGYGRRACHRLMGPRHADRLMFSQTVKRIAAKQSPVTVGFVVCSPAKWSTQALFHLLDADPDFSPAFYPTLSDACLRLPRSERAIEYAKTRSFFSGIGQVATDLYDPALDRMRRADALDADVVFIQQPWGMQDFPRQIAGTSLPAYVHYGYPVIRNDAMQFGLRGFHPFLWSHYIPDPVQADAMRASGLSQAVNLPVTGHPKLDVYLEAAPKREEVSVWPRAPDAGRKRIIFAPHHSRGAGSLNLATFEWSGPAMLALVLAHPDMDFVLKPHPNLEHEMTRAGGEIAATYQDVMRGWKDAANAVIIQGGDYFDLFRTSDAMITDSGSFLAEYLPTGMPLIRLTKHGSAPLNASGQALAEAFYCADSQDELNRLFEQIILVQGDPRKEQRAIALARLLPDERSSAQRILAHLRAELRS